MKLQATLDCGTTRLQALMMSFVERTGTEFGEVKADLGRGGTTIITGSVHDVMKVIGVLADEGEAALVSATRVP